MHELKKELECVWFLLWGFFIKGKVKEDSNNIMSHKFLCS